MDEDEDEVEVTLPCRACARRDTETDPHTCYIPKEPRT